MGDKITILVIDDEKCVRNACRQILTEEGYNVESAEDGTVGLEKLPGLKPDVVLIDLKMPGLSGVEVLKKTKEIDPTICPIVITGYATLESAIEAMKCGAYDFLPKPFTPDELQVIVHRGLERRRLFLETIRLEQEKEEMRKYFITLVSHQLHSPLATIQQNLGVILAGMLGEMTEEQEKTLSQMHGRINELLMLIKDWLDISKIEKGKLVETLEPVAVGAILSETVKSLQPMAEEKKVALHLDVENLHLIKGDCQSLKQLFSNLINNAIKFNRASGKVNINAYRKNGDVEIKIADTGLGIASEDLPFIFDEFYQVKSEETERISGTGLGLSIAKKIVEAHAGTITVESTKGKGSAFLVRLPKISE